MTDEKLQEKQRKADADTQRARRTRQAEALRDNLARRKVQARQRQDNQPPVPSKG